MADELHVETGPDTADDRPASKAVSGPPENKAVKPRPKPCPTCGADLAPYAGTQTHKQGRMECPACGNYFAN